MAEKLRVLAVLPQLGLGGIQVMYLELLPKLRAEGLDVALCVVGDEGPLEDAFRELGCRVERIRKSASCRVTAGRFENVLARGQYDVVHSHLSYTSGGLALAAARRTKPICVSLHNGGPTSLYRWRGRTGLAQIRSRWLGWHRGLEQRTVDLWIGHSAANLDAYACGWRLCPDRYRLVRNAVKFPPERLERQACRQALRFSPQRCVLLHVGRFAPQKNHAGLLEIFARVCARRRDAQLVLVGDGPDRAEVEQAARRMGVAERVRFEGPQQDVWPYYHAADVFVFPSELEGFGNVLAESQISRLPVVASDIGPHRESVAPSQHRFLFPLPDYDHAADLVVAQLDHAARSPGAAPEWVASAEQFVRQQFSLERMAAELAAVLREVAWRRRDGTRAETQECISSWCGSIRPTVSSTVV